MAHKVAWHRRLAHKIGYDIDKFNKQLTVESHLRALLQVLEIDLVLDVGANEGQYGEMLRYVGYTGDILSFEPGNAAFGKLQKTSKDDNRWQAHNVALSDSSGEAELHLSGASVFNSLHETSDFGTEKFGASIESSSTETVALIRLDEFAKSQIPDFTTRRVFLKMDTQGHDQTVFAGAGELRNQLAGLQSEISAVPIYQGIPDYMECMASYREFGYEVTGLFTVNRHRVTGHVIEFDCVMAPRAPA